MFNKKSKASGVVAVTVTASHLNIAHMQLRKEKPFLAYCESIAIKSEQDAVKQLQSKVQQHGLQGLACHYVLKPSDYSLHLVEAPDVEPDEMKAAVRWKIKDLLDMKVEEAVIDVFQLPGDAYRGRSDMVYVVACKRAEVEKTVKWLAESGLELAVIDIPELAIKNISSHYIDDNQGVAFLDLHKSASTMSLNKNQTLYLTRRINTPLDHDVMGSLEWEGLKNKLVLEMQRSLDYFESQMGQGQITKIYIAPRLRDTAEMTKSLDEMLAAQVSALDIAGMLASAQDLTPQLQHSCLTVIGAALRLAPLAKLSEADAA